MFIVGIKAKKIGRVTVSEANCPDCKQTGKHQIFVFGRFLHFFWIPMFPIGKIAVSECSHCKKALPKRHFSFEIREKYRLSKREIRRPRRHWTGLGLICILSLLFLFQIATVEQDPRNELLKRDLAVMNLNPRKNNDSISYKIKQAFSEFENNFNTNKIAYFSKIAGDNALILVTIPELKKLEKSTRSKVMEMIQFVADQQKDLRRKKLFIGIQGSITMMLIRTPTKDENKLMADRNLLLGFYGLIEEK